MFRKLRIKLKEREYRKYIEEHRQNIRDAFVELSTCPDLDWVITEDISAKLFERIKLVIFFIKYTLNSFSYSTT